MTVQRSTAEVGSLYPSLYYDDAHGAIEWLCRAFGFERRLVVPGPSGSILHSELSLGGAIEMVSTTRPDQGLLSPRSVGAATAGLSLFVTDPDAHFARARAAGANITRELRDEEYGARGYKAKDPEGHVWYFGNYVPGAHWTN